MLEIITSVLEALSGYIGGRVFKDKKYTYKKIIMSSFVVSILFFLAHSCYEFLFWQKEFIKISFIISLISFIVILLMLLLLKIMNDLKK
ncbi:hypothetical protein B0682_01410 [Moraxella lincolnii]|uniref:Uncharacterized protein n=1 Tax=Lwoffella lincolnii TaxID=90241 RepID=A0A1T0CJD3_9GAMM|nr:hypothetical protein B0682_01410 [Moraxella lincolnii]